MKEQKQISSESQAFKDLEDLSYDFPDEEWSLKNGELYSPDKANEGNYSKRLKEGEHHEQLKGGRAARPPRGEAEPVGGATKLTDAQKIQLLRAMASKLLEEKIPFADRLPLLRARAGDLGITLRDSELNRIIRDARRAAAGAVDGLGPGDLINLSPTPWHLEGVLMPEVLNLLVALPKVGKTSLILAMLAAWHRGVGSFLGLPLHGTCPPVLIVGTDQPDNDWGRMLKEVGLLPEGTISWPIVRLFHRGSPLHLSPEGIEAIASYAATHPKLFVLLDSVAALTSPLGLDENSAEIVEPINDLLEALEPYGATVVAIHHASKGRAGESATLASRGSTALPAAASQIISLGRVATGRPGEPQNRRLVLKTEGRAGMPQHLLIERTEEGWISHGSADAVALAQRLQEVEEKLNDRQADALGLVRERWDLGDRTEAKALVEALGLKGDGADRTARRTLDGLVRKGLLRSATDATPQGRIKRWWPVGDHPDKEDGTLSRGGMCDVSEASEVSDPPQDQKDGAKRPREGKVTSDREDTQGIPPCEGVRSPRLPKPWHAEAVRIHREGTEKAAFTVALELERLGYPGITGRQVDELWREVE